MPEIENLTAEYLNISLKGANIFGIFEDLELKAFGGLRCYQGGHYMLRGCIVKPEFRGQGLQIKLIKERLEFASDKTNKVRAKIFPDNLHSIDNVLASGFNYEKKEKFEDGSIVNVYRFDF